MSIRVTRQYYMSIISYYIDIFRDYVDISGMSYHFPGYREQLIGRGLLQPFYQGIALFNNAVFHLKNFLPLASLLFFQFLDLLLDFMLFVEISRKPGLPLLK